MAWQIAMGKFSHLSKRRGRDDDDDDFDPLPRKGLGNVPPHLSVKYYRMSKVVPLTIVYTLNTPGTTCRTAV